MKKRDEKSRDTFSVNLLIQTLYKFTLCHQLAAEIRQCFSPLPGYIDNPYTVMLVSCVSCRNQRSGQLSVDTKTNVYKMAAHSTAQLAILRRHMGSDGRSSRH